MKIVNRDKENGLVMILTFTGITLMCFSGWFTLTINLKLFSIAMQLCLFLFAVFYMAYGMIVSGIDENLWDEFKKGNDAAIDRLMRGLNWIGVFLVILSLVWIIGCLYIYYYSLCNITKTLFLIAFPPPVIISCGFLIYNFRLQQSYKL